MAISKGCGAVMIPAPECDGPVQAHALIEYICRYDQSGFKGQKND
jgi:hypothetical protein